MLFFCSAIQPAAKYDSGNNLSSLSASVMSQFRPPPPTLGGITKQPSPNPPHGGAPQQQQQRKAVVLTPTSSQADLFLLFIL